MIRATIRDKNKKQHTRPTEAKAEQLIAREAAEEGIEVDMYIRLCRWAAKDIVEPSVFSLVHNMLSQTDAKRRFLRPEIAAQALFATEFGRLGEEP